MQEKEFYMRTKSVFRMSVLLVLIAGLGVMMSCNHGNKVSQQGSGGSVNTQRSLDELICGSNGFYFYFSRGSVYVCQFKNDSWQKFSAGTYVGNQFTDLDGEKYTVIVSEITVTFQGPEPATHLICTDPNILKIVKNL